MLGLNADRINKTYKDCVRKIKQLRERFRPTQKRIGKFIEKRPVFSFFILLFILIALIIVGNMLRRPPDQKEAKPPVKQVQVFSIGKAPTVTFSGRVEKSGVLKITAQSGGVVQNILHHEGEIVGKGTPLVWLSTNYQGGNLQSASRQIAEQSFTATEDNYPKQLAMIAKRREIAQKADIQAQELRDISNKSIGDTENLISLNRQIVDSINNQISVLQASPSATTDATILQLQQAKSGVLTGLLNLTTSLRNIQYQSNNSNTPGVLGDLTRDVTLQGLDVEERSLKLQKEIAKLNLTIAQISESLMYPVSPCEGTVERVYVFPGQNITPGTQLLSLTCQKNVAQVIVTVSGEMAKNISRLEKSTMGIGGQNVELFPRYISTEPTEGSLHTVLFIIPDTYEKYMTDHSRLAVSIPVGHPEAPASNPFVPIDAVFQTETSSVIYIASPSGQGTYIVASREVALGNVFGSYVEVLKGLIVSDQVIMDRNVISGDEIKIN